MLKKIIISLCVIVFCSSGMNGADKSESPDQQEVARVAGTLKAVYDWFIDKATTDGGMKFFKKQRVVDGQQEKRGGIEEVETIHGEEYIVDVAKPVELGEYTDCMVHDYFYINYLVELRPLHSPGCEVIRVQAAMKKYHKNSHYNKEDIYPMFTEGAVLPLPKKPLAVENNKLWSSVFDQFSNPGKDLLLGQRMRKNDSEYVYGKINGAYSVQRSIDNSVVRMEKNSRKLKPVQSVGLSAVVTPQILSQKVFSFFPKDTDTEPIIKRYSLELENDKEQGKREPRKPSVVQEIPQGMTKKSVHGQRNDETNSRTKKRQLFTDQQDAQKFVLAVTALGIGCKLWTMTGRNK